MYFYRITETSIMPVLRLILPIVIFATLLVGCTRSRSTTEPTVVDDPVVLVTITATVGSADPLVVVSTVAPEATTETTTPTPALTVTPSTIDYYVQDGDTISSVAAKFNVDVETVRRLNYLLDDNIFVGQILQMPFQEGITAEGAPTATPMPFRYEVVTGDSLGLIAQQFGVSTVAIMEANEMSDPNSLYVGQQLVIPGYAADSPTSSAGESSPSSSSAAPDTGETPVTNVGSVTHVVQPGDTLYAIAESYGVEAAAIMSTNNIANGNQLRVGQQLTIPGISALDAAKARGRVHIVQSGESLTAIAVLYGVTAQEIIEFNGLSNPDAIYVGQQLIVPGQ
jgi:LysM repeat protein